jgi:hypothetical protein
VESGKAVIKNMKNGEQHPIELNDRFAEVFAGISAEWSFSDKLGLTE